MEFTSRIEQPPESGMKHVALLDAEGGVIIHEELPAGKAPDRYKMLCLQVELDAAGLNEDHIKKECKAYMGDVWPIPEPATAGIE